MAAALDNSKTLCSSPFLIRRLEVTSDATEGLVTHGGPGVPDIVFHVGSGTGAPATSAMVWSKDESTDTQIYLDFEAGSQTYFVYCIWLQAAVQDGSSIGG